MATARSCAVCDGRYLTPTLGALSLCQNCQHVQFFFEPSEAASIYTDGWFNGGEYAGYLGQEEALRKSMRRHLEQMASYGPLGGGLLEVGCAYGLFLDEAGRHFDQVMGVDICEGPVAHARTRFSLDVRCEDFARMDLPAESFDVVCMWDTIEHLPNPTEFVTSAARVLKRSGRLYLTTGDVRALNARLRGRRWRQIRPPSHLQYFSRVTMRRMLDRCGFDVLGIETASYYHTLYNVLAVTRLRGGFAGRVATGGLRLLGDANSRRMGSWINLGDTMFVAAQKR